MKDKNSCSKGNQPKFEQNGYWYKQDYLGYEGASEYVVSEILKHSNISNFVSYEIVPVEFNNIVSNGCKSKNFLPPLTNIMTVEDIIRLSHNKTGTKFLDNKSTKERIETIVDLVEEYTGLNHFGEYLTTILELDYLVLNEDRHLNNIAILVSNDRKFDYCPIFDNGAAFLSDTHIDYPLDTPIRCHLNKVKAKPFSTDFSRQVEIAESLYGKQLQIEKDYFLPTQIKEELSETYGQKIASRIYVSNIAQQQIYERFRSDNLMALSWEIESENIKRSEKEYEEEYEEYRDEEYSYDRDNDDFDEEMDLDNNESDYDYEI